MEEQERTPDFDRFDVFEIASKFPDTPDTLLFDTYLTNEEARGPTLMEDSHFWEKIFHFDHERIPERVVHARGFVAHGFFETYESSPT
jgi:hypothetical protein